MMTESRSWPWRRRGSAWLIAFSEGSWNPTRICCIPRFGQSLARDHSPCDASSGEGKLCLQNLPNVRAPILIATKRETHAPSAVSCFCGIDGAMVHTNPDDQIVRLLLSIQNQRS